MNGRIGEKHKMRRPASLMEVARRSGYSTATVSRAFNNPEKVTSHTRKHILKVAEDLRYRPNRLVNGVIRGKVPIIGIVISNMQAAFIPDLLGGIFDVCGGDGFTSMVYDCNKSLERETEALQLCVQHRLSGIIYYPNGYNSPEHQQILDEINELGIPIVYIMTPVQGNETDISIIENDDYDGSMMAMRHLIELGHRRILHLWGSKKYFRPSDLRMQAYKDSLVEAGIGIDESLIHYAGFGPFIENPEMIENFDVENKPFTAIFAASDYTATHAIQILQRKGLRVPQDVSIIGVGDLPFTELLSPPLTTLRQNFRELGSQAAQVCLKSAGSDERTEPETVVVPLELIERESTGPVNN